MAERRRRRRLSEEEESGEEVSEDVKNNQVPIRPSECESEDEHLAEDVEVSDYESITEGKEPCEEAAVVEDDDDEEEDDDDDGSEEESEDDSDEESESSSEDDDDDDDDDDESDGGVDYADDADGLEEERQSGDGEEQPGEEKDKELDDDEDRRNPAYVPRRGAFYEHDTRITEDAEKERIAPKKKLWKDEGKWQHDRFHEDQQAPKSREELMVLYGYDILARDQPPPTAPRINKSRMRNPQRRQQLKDFIGDPQWSGRRTSPDVQQKNYRNRKPARGGGRNRPSDYGDSRRDYGERHEVIETRRDHGDVRRDYIDNRGDQEENRKTEEIVETRGRSSENCHVSEELKIDAEEKVSTDGHQYKRELSENCNEFSELKKDHFEKRRDYVDNRKESGNNRHDSSDNRRDSSDNRRDSSDNRRNSSDNRRNSSDNRRDYDTNTSGNVSWKVHNSVERSHSNGEVKSNNSFRGNHKSPPPRSSYTNANYYRGETSANNKTDLEKFSLPAFKKNPENNSNYKNIEPTNYRSDARSYKSLNHEANHRNHIINNRGYRKVENHSGHSYRNHNESKHLRTPERNFSPEDVHDPLSKPKGAILNNIEFSGSVVTANNSMEKKSYSKERRIKGMARTRMQPVHPHESAVESERNSFTSDKTTIQQDGKLEINTGPSKVEHVTRPKRYSTQRQRNLPEVNYPDQIPVDGTTYYSQNFTQGPQHVFHPDQVPPTHQEGAAFQPTMLQTHTPIPYTLPVSTPGLPSPPRMFGPPPVPVSIATAPSPAAAAMLPPQYLGAGVIYGAPPPGPYQVPVISGYQSPPPPQQPTSGLQELYRGGTTYYSTDLQQPSPSRSPVRRQKSAIPIINPQDVKTKETTSANDTESSSCSHDNSQDKIKEETSIASSENVVESAASAECINQKESVSFDRPTSADADGGTSCASSASTAASAAMISKEASPPPSEKEERETNHKPVDLVDTCTPSEQATQPILEAAA